MTKVEIVNLALGRLNEAPIVSLDERSAASNAAKLYYDASRREVLRSFNWGFALRLESLALLDEGVSDFPFVYALPEDCLRVIRILRQGDPDFASGAGQEFVTRSGKVYTYVSDAMLEYVSNVEDANDFDGKFTEALSYKLAADMAYSVTGKLELANHYLGVYQQLIGEAATVSMSEQRQCRPMNPYKEARFR